MAEFVIKTNIPHVLRRISTYDAELQDAIEASGEELGEQGTAELRQNAPRKTGQLADAFRHEVTRSGLTVRVFWTVAEHLNLRLTYVQKGTRPHAIVAHGGALHFNGMYRRRVQHPGGRPNDFAERTIRLLDARSYFERAGERFAAQAD